MDTQVWGKLRRLLNSVLVRTLLSTAIVLSLLPFDWVLNHDAFFLAIFLPEFALRVVLACRVEASPNPALAALPSGWRRPNATDASLLLLDLIALISFAPLGGLAIADARWLRLFRLARIVLLARYWAPEVRDLWTIITERERARQLLLMALLTLGFSFGGTVALDHAPGGVQIDFDGNGQAGNANDQRFATRLWWAFRQIEDPGNMLESPYQLAAVGVSFTLTLFGIFVVSFLIGVGADVVRELMTLSRIRAPGFDNHTVVVNITPSTRKLLVGLMLHAHKRSRSGRSLDDEGSRFVVVGNESEAPDFLREPAFARVAYRENMAEEDDATLLVRADIPHARRVVLLADGSAGAPDDETIRMLLSLVHGDYSDKHRPSVVCEIVDESNLFAARQAVTRQAAVDVTLVATEKLLALFMVCVARRPHAAPLLQEAFEQHGHELYSAKLGTEFDILEASPKRTFERVRATALSTPTASVVPIGLTLDDGSTTMRPREASGPRVTGFIAFARDESEVRQVARRLHSEPPSKRKRPKKAPRPRFLTRPAATLDRVLLCGFSQATVSLVKALLQAEPEARVLVMTASNAERELARDAFDAHSNLVRRGLLPGEAGEFLAVGPNEFSYLPDGSEGVKTGSVVLSVGDFTSSRRLLELPAGFGACSDMRAVFLVTDERSETDARVATALMKLEGLRELSEARTEQQIVAEVLDVDLARRLRQRYRDRLGVQVFSVQELRAGFMVQATLVHEFQEVYEELLSPRGLSFVELGLDKSARPFAFAQLSRTLGSMGATLLAVELSHESSQRLCFAAADAPTDAFDAKSVDRLWVLADDRFDPSNPTPRPDHDPDT